jgi:PST family polysaccharide transporter
LLYNKIARNVLSQTIGRAISFLLIFFSFTIAARKLGVEQFGLFASVLALVAIISKIVDMGFGQIVFRECSKDDNYELVNNAVILRIIASLFIVFSTNIIFILLRISQLEILVFNVLFINIYISSRFLNIRDLYEVPFKVELKMHLVMLTVILDNVLLLIFVIIMPTSSQSLIYFTVLYVICNLPGFVSLLVMLKATFKFKFKFYLNRSKWIIKESSPLFGYVLILAIFQQVDVIILKNIDSNFSAGIYSAASRLTLPLSIIPIAIISTVYPSIVKNFNKNNYSKELRRLIQKVLFIISYSVFVVFLFKSEEFVIIIFGNEFRDAHLPAIILFGGFVFLFYNFFSLDLLTAFGKQKFHFLYELIIVTIDIVLVLLSVSDFSYIGVAAAKSIAIIIGSIFLILIYNKFKLRLKYMDWSIILWAVVIFLICVLTSSLPLIIYITISVIAVVIIGKITKLFKENEISIIKKLLVGYKVK